MTTKLRIRHIRALPGADEWRRIVQDGPVTAGGRGMNRALVYTQDGKLIASVAQAGSIRVHS